MKTKNKILSLLLSITALFSIIPKVSFAQIDYVDYGTKLEILENKLKECELMGISTEYETVNYTVIKHFCDYINEDIDNGVAESEINYNISALNKLYNEAVSNLDSYIAGEKTPFESPRANMFNLKRKGSVLYDDERPVLAVGYGHFNQARRDISDFQNFGADNIQMEIGPTSMVYSFGGWLDGTNRNPTGTVEQSSSMYHSGKNSLKVKKTSDIEENVYFRLYQNISCSPLSKYKFGCWSRSNDTNEIWVSANGFHDRNHITDKSGTWNENIWTYETGEEQTTIEFSMVIEGVTTVYLDDFYLYEVDENGNSLSENLLKNPGFETGWGYDDCISYLTDALTVAEESNIGVSLLLSPHYFPQNLDEELYTNKGVFINYNINAPEAKKVIEEYLRNLLPYLTDYSAISNICISNEPVFDTRNFMDFYNPFFREYLEALHGDINTLNECYNTEYKSFEEILMPLEDVSEPIYYDWVDFNDKIFTDWHKWMISIVKEYFPNMPVHSKMMKYFSPRSAIREDSDRSILARGTDLELFSEFSDILGNDTYDYVYNTDTYYRTMFLYDYQSSIADKPIYNSEDHIIQNKSEIYNIDQRKHWRNNLWQGAIHGRNASTAWVWERSYNQNSDFYKSVLTRPDVVAEAGKTALDLNRLAYEVTSIQQKQPDVALLYSKPSRVYSDTHMQNLLEIYKNLLNIGQKPGIVSDKSISSLEKYKVLIIPDVSNCKKETFASIESFIRNGGKVIYYNTLPSKNEYNQAVFDISYLKDNAYIYIGNDNGNQLLEYLKNWGIQKIYLVDETTRKIPSDMDWQYTIEGNKILLNISSLDYEKTKNISVCSDDFVINSFNDLISDTFIGSNITFSAYEPKMLECEIVEKEKSKITNIYKHAEKILWDYNGNDYIGANVYRLTSSGNLSFKADVSNTEFTFGELPETYVVKAVNSDKTECDGKIITVAENEIFRMNAENITVKNGRVNLKIKMENLHSSYATGVATVEILNSDGDVTNINFQKITLPKGKECTYEISMCIDENDTVVRIYAADSMLGKNIYSNIVSSELT